MLNLIIPWWCLLTEELLSSLFAPRTTIFITALLFLKPWPLVDSVAVVYGTSAYDGYLNARCLPFCCCRPWKTFKFSSLSWCVLRFALLLLKLKANLGSISWAEHVFRTWLSFLSEFLGLLNPISLIRGSDFEFRPALQLFFGEKTQS